jgi:hypothetical protein
MSQSPTSDEDQLLARLADRVTTHLQADDPEALASELAHAPQGAADVLALVPLLRDLNNLSRSRTHSAHPEPRRP